MRRSSKNVLLVSACLMLLVCAVGIWLLTRSAEKQGLSVTYLGVVDGIGHWRLRFGITNVGNSRVFTSKVGHIEVFNRTNALSVGVTAPMSQLSPGEGHVVEAVLSETQMKSLDTKWRFACLYSADELRSRIYRWQWGPGGQGNRINWLIPRKLKGMPLTLKGTGDWIEPDK